MEPYMVIYQMGDHVSACFFKNYENVREFYNTCVTMGHTVECYKWTENGYELWYRTKCEEN